MTNSIADLINSFIDTIQKDNLCERVTQLGERIRTQLKTHLDQTGLVKEYRGKGLMIGVVLNTEENAAGIMKSALEAGLLLNVTAGNVVRLLPPFVLTDEEADAVAQKTAEQIIAFFDAKK